MFSQAFLASLPPLSEGAVDVSNPAHFDWAFDLFAGIEDIKGGMAWVLAAVRQAEISLQEAEDV